ncbi:hypothetical protein JS756_36025, partial [Streptomyces actuosus]|nr:hypothetical protein [Streptomyces actuosus]
MDKQASTIKQLLRQRINSPSTPSKIALDQLIKGCGMAINNAVLLSKENQDLRAAHEKQIQKRTRSRKQMAVKEGLSIQEGQELLQSENQADVAISTALAESAPEAELRSVRAPPRGSDCHL